LAKKITWIKIISFLKWFIENWKPITTIISLIGTGIYRVETNRVKSDKNSVEIIKNSIEIDSLKKQLSKKDSVYQYQIKHGANL